ncbi:MAG TPA: NAD(P)H-dependent oxidoreductase subunit E [Mariprofundaceae bacterium]|nr:NAD(P)H-dependent oxidoreductase subunit E [Mariprofundaceae bacterium]
MTSIPAQEIRELLESKGYSSAAYLLAALEDVQASCGVLDDESLAAVAAHFRLPEAKVRALVADCTEAFRSASAPELRICLGPVCRNAGSEALLEKAGNAAASSHCMGACDHAPVAKLNGKLIAEATPEDLGL